MIESLTEYVQESVKTQWHPTLPAPVDIFQSNWPYFPVKFNADFTAMHDECIRNDHLFVGHRQQDKHLSYNHEGWSAITLHGISPTATENYEQYGFKSVEDANYHWTEVCDLFPKCVEFIKSLKYSKYDRVRIMKLAAGGYIMPHVDGPGRVFGPLNIAINNPELCNFYFKDYGVVPFSQGQGNFLDIGNEHIVWNRSTQDRYHFIVHGHITNHVLNLAYSQLKNHVRN